MKKPTQRHFPYQHPTFGTDKRPKPARYWENTIYYQWWSYLKRNEKYLETCQKDGRGMLADLYNDFGDVRDDSFKNWWTKDSRGMRLFAEPQALATIQEITKEESLSINGDVLLVAVPLDLPKRFLIRRFREILNKYHKGKVGKQHAKQSKAKYRFKGQPNVHALKTALFVYDYIIANPKIRLWQVGKVLPQFQMELLKLERAGEKPSYDFKRTIEATVSRYKRKASVSISNVAKGVFP